MLRMPSPFLEVSKLMLPLTLRPIMSIFRRLQQWNGCSGLAWFGCQSTLVVQAAFFKPRLLMHSRPEAARLGQASQGIRLQRERRLRSLRFRWPFYIRPSYFRPQLPL